MPSANDHPSANTPLYQSDLAQTPLPEILVTIHRYKAPGVIECRRSTEHGDELKRIYLDHGNIVFASTNQIAESLGDKLLRDGKITREQYDESVRLLKKTGKRHGVTLVEMKVLSPQDLFIAVRDHLQEIVWSMFRWESGLVVFRPGREKQLEFVKVEIPVPLAVMQGVRRIGDARALVARLGTKTTLLEKTGKTVDDLELEADEERLLEEADGKKMLFELVNTPPLSAPDNAHILYGLFALQLVAKKEPRQIKVQIKTESGKTPL